MRADVLAALPVALAELLIARLRLARLRPSELTRETSFSGEVARDAATNLPPDLGRIAWLIPRIAARLPWRADCLVQALAARRWLGRLGHSTTLSLGTRRHADGRLEAHAWLTWQGLIVTGGDVSAYRQFLRNS